MDAEPRGTRIAAFLARCGVASRRKSEELVSAGRVRVNGAVATDLGRRVDPDSDRVEFDGQTLRLAEEHVTLLFHKPRLVLVSRGDRFGRKTVYDCLPPEFRPLAPRLVYAGRLDFESEGLLVMSTDGEVANRLTHPSRHHEKEYRVWLDRALTEAELLRLESGVFLEGRRTHRCRVAPAPAAAQEGPQYTVVLEEGRKRQVRLMIQSIGARVERLVRVRVGPFKLGDLGPGQWRRVEPEEFFTDSLFP